MVNDVKVVERYANQGLCTSDEYRLIYSVMASKAPANVLVFGVGADSVLWVEANKSGKTVFIEDDVRWINKVQTMAPCLDIRTAEYVTKKEQWKKQLADRRVSELNLDSDVLQTDWDVIFVDGPAGNKQESPGRLQSIYMSSVLAKKAIQHVDVFVHDYHRDLEKACANVFLGRPIETVDGFDCLLYTSPSPRDVKESRMPSSA